MKTFNNKKGQAAMEFLMTYGWAILAAVVVIGALGTYFYFNQGSKTSIFTQPPFYGSAAQVNAGQLVLEIANQGGQDLSSVNVSVSGYGCTENTTGFDGAAAGPQIVTLDCTGATSGTRVTGDISIAYLTPNSQLPQYSTGSVSGTVA